jgi:lipopolysaccharide export system protein LptC
VIGKSPRLRRLAPFLLLLVACQAPPPDEGRAPPEVTLHDVRLRSYRGSTLTAVGRAEVMSYERSSADVLAQHGTFDVFRLEAPRPRGAPPPATHIEAQAALGNLLTRGIDASGGVTLQTPTGLRGWTERAHLDSPTMKASGTSRVSVTGPHGYWLEAGGFELQLREEIYEFTNMRSRVSAL